MDRADAATWPEFMTTEQVAWAIGVKDQRTVLALIRAGTLPATRIGHAYRVSKAAVLGLLR